VRRAILSAVLLAAAIVLQLTVVNRLPLPGSGPDLVLLCVVCLGLCGGPVAGAVTGFCAGLAFDLAPPGSYLIGEYALVFCVMGYLCGRLRGSLNRSAALTIALAMAAAAAGEALYAVLGLVVSDPQVTWSAVRQVLPSSVIYDVVVSPFLLYAVVRAVHWADGRARGAEAERQADGAALLARAHAPGGALPGRPGMRVTVLGGAGLLGGAGWLAGPVGSRGARGARKGAGVHVPRTPRLRQAAARTGDGWLGGGPRTGLPASARHVARRPGRPPRLRPGSGVPGSAAARPSPRALPRSSVNLRITAPRRRDGSLGRGLGPAAGAGLAGSAVRRRGSGPPGSAFRSRRPSVGAAAALARSGPPTHSPRFRPDPRMRGGSSTAGGIGAGALRGAVRSGEALRGGGLGGATPRLRSARGVNLRLRPGRRHDGALGGGGLRGGGTVGLGGLRGARRGGGLRGGMHRGLGARPVSLRLGSGRRGDGALGGSVLGNRGSWVRSRQATPRFRSGTAVGGRSLLGRRAALSLGKRSRFSPGRTSLLATLTQGRLGARSTVWRIGSRRTGGLR
jgi:rod shape-determining protein MreD